MRGDALVYDACVVGESRKTESQFTLIYSDPLKKHAELDNAVCKELAQLPIIKQALSTFNMFNF